MRKLRVIYRIILLRFLTILWGLTIPGHEKHFTAFLRDQKNGLDEKLVRSLNQPGSFSWDSAKLPQQLEDFSDLTFLFWLTPLNRGLLRQDMDEASALYQTVASLSQPRGVEIGRFFGASTILLAIAVGDGGKVISIDIAPQNDDRVNSILNQFHLMERVELVVGDANKTNIEGDLDFVFIDGDHSYEGARSDHNKWSRCVKVGGYVIHHDMANARPYATHWQSLEKLREEILSKQKTQLKLVKEVGSLCIFQRTGPEFTEL